MQYKKINILHISDAHFTNSCTSDQRRITKSICEAIECFKEKIDYCIFTGDLANQGSESEYIHAEQWLEQIYRSINNLNADMYICPGNHDVQRNKSKKVVLRGAATDRDLYKSFKIEERKSLNHLSDFFNWHDRFKKKNSWIKSDWQKDVNLISDSRFGFNINFIMANSAILSCSDSDQGNLCIDIDDLNDCLEQCENNGGLNLFMMHHPLDGEWFADWNQKEVEKLLSQKNGCHLIMCGHAHDNLAYQKSDNLGRRLATIKCGTAYPHEHWKKEFSIIEIDINKESVTPNNYTYSDEAGKWFHREELSQTIKIDLSNVKSLSAHKEEKTQKSDNEKFEVNFFNSKFENIGLDEIKISSNVFIDNDTDYDFYHKNFDCIICLPQEQIINQVPTDQHLTGISICIQNISKVHNIIEKHLHKNDMNILLATPSNKKVPDEIKLKIVNTIQEISRLGFIISATIPVKIIDHCDEKIKTKSVYYALINVILSTVFKEISNISIQKIDVYLASKGRLNSGIDSRICRLARKSFHPNNVKRIFTCSEKEVNYRIVERILGMASWFVSHQDKSEWLDKIKGKI